MNSKCNLVLLKKFIHWIFDLVLITLMKTNEKPTLREWKKSFMVIENKLTSVRYLINYEENY